MYEMEICFPVEMLKKHRHRTSGKELQSSTVNLKAKFLWYGHQTVLKFGKYEVFGGEALHFPASPDQSVETFEQKS
jgi:hypothetical protein